MIKIELGDWKCYECGNWNFDKRANCNKYKAEKKDKKREIIISLQLLKTNQVVITILNKIIRILINILKPSS